MAPITEEGYAALEREYQKLEKKLRSITRRIKKGADDQDLRENNAWSMALEDKEKTEQRMAELKEILHYAKVSPKSKLKDGTQKKCILGSKVKVKINSEEETYHLVGQFEANSTQNKISTKSPIGKALLNKKIGQSVTVKLPNQTLKIKILDIS